MHWFILIALWGFIGFSVMNAVPLDYFYYIWVPTGVGFFIWGISIEKEKVKDQLSIEKEKMRVANIEKQSLSDKYGLPINCQQYKYLSGYDKISSNTKASVWIKANTLNILIGKEDMQKYQIPLSDIKFYSVKGDIRQETENIGGKATLGETVVAEGLLGTAAAMKKNQVMQNIKTIDERKTIINATIEGENSFIFFEGAELYNYLLENIPEKEQSFVAMNK